MGVGVGRGRGVGRRGVGSREGREGRVQGRAWVGVRERGGVRVCLAMISWGE